MEEEFGLFLEFLRILGSQITGLTILCATLFHIGVALEIAL
jgi:hypothetical protein